MPDSILPACASHLKPSGIYQIKNLVNSKVYVGSAKDIHKRWWEHRAMLEAGKHHSVKLQRAWLKHGRDAFVFTLLEEVDCHVFLVPAEQRWIDFYASATSLGYNVCPTAGSTLGRAFSQEAKLKMSAAWVGRKVSDATREKQSIAHKGKPKSSEHRERMASANKARGEKATSARLKREDEAKAIRSQLRLVPPAPNCTCSSCGKAFYTKPSEVARGAKFCSPSCYHSATKDEFTRTCRKCGERFVFPREKDRRYCPPCAVRGSDKGVIWSEPKRGRA